MTLVGLTGPYCAGKNYIARFFEERGIPVLDVDTLGHIALENRQEAVTARFGRAILGANGRINRRALGRHVFGKPEELAALERIVHPEAARLTLEWLANRRESLCVINAALLRGTPVADQFALVVLAKAPLWLRALRALRRDRLSPREIIRRFASQHHFLQKFLPGNADIVGIRNAGTGLFPARDRQKMSAKIDAIVRKLKERPETSPLPD